MASKKAPKNRRAQTWAIIKRKRKVRQAKAKPRKRR